MSLELLQSEDSDDFVSYHVEPVVEDVVGTVYNNFRQTQDGSRLMNLARRLLQNAERHLQELLFEELLLLGLLFHLVHDVPDELPDRFTDGVVKSVGALFLNPFREIGQHLRDERHKSFLKDLCRNPELFDLLLHLVDFHVLIQLCQQVQEQEHLIVVRDIGGHQFLEFLRTLLHGVDLPELAQDLQKVVLEIEQFLLVLLA